MCSFIISASTIINIESLVFLCFLFRFILYFMIGNLLQKKTDNLANWEFHRLLKALISYFLLKDKKFIEWLSRKLHGKIANMRIFLNIKITSTKKPDCFDNLPYVTNSCKTYSDSKAVNLNFRTIQHSNKAFLVWTDKDCIYYTKTRFIAKNSPKKCFSYNFL